MTVGESRAMLGFSPDEKLRAQVQSSPPRNPWGASHSLSLPPPAFDARLKWPGRIHTPRDQGKCASSWAYTATSVMADRIAIHWNFLHNDNLSPQQLISCDYNPNQNGCKAGDPLSAFQNYLKNVGCLSETCYPSTSNVSGIRGTCLSGMQLRPICPNPNAQFLKYRSIGGSKVNGSEAAEYEVYLHGPIGDGMKVYQDLYAYYGVGIYKHVSGQFVGMHSLRIIGWGRGNWRENYTEYWLVANSWGTNWGYDGYFRIKKGTNECEIESNFMSVF